MHCRLYEGLWRHTGRAARQPASDGLRPLQARCRGTSTRSSRSRKISRPTPLSRRRPRRIPCRTAPPPFTHSHAHARMHTHACMGVHVPRWFVYHSVPIYRSDAAVRRTERCRYWEDEFARLNQLAYYNMCHFKVGRCCAAAELTNPIDRSADRSIAHLRTVVAAAAAAAAITQRANERQ